MVEKMNKEAAITGFSNFEQNTNKGFLLSTLLQMENPADEPLNT